MAPLSDFNQFISCVMKRWERARVTPDIVFGCLNLFRRELEKLVAIEYGSVSEASSILALWGAYHIVVDFLRRGPCLVRDYFQELTSSLHAEVSRQVKEISGDGDDWAWLSACK